MIFLSMKQVKFYHQAVKNNTRIELLFPDGSNSTVKGYFIIHPCDLTVVICYLIWPCDIAVRITYLISHSSSLIYNTVINSLTTRGPAGPYIDHVLYEGPRAGALACESIY